MKRVAVIGAGAAGLCATRYLSAKPELFEPVVFEKADCIGGTWVYTEDTGTDKHGLPIHSSMYRNLKTNIPKEVMAFPDLPFDPNLPSFVTHKDMLHYLEQYAAKFDLLKYIKFESFVESVHPVSTGYVTQWEVTVRDLNNKETSLNTTVFDAVMVCNGHYSVPHIPTIFGQETFKGTILHSHAYRKPEDYKDSTIVFVGAGNSAQDIMLDLYSHVKQIYLSHWKKPLTSELPSNIMQVPTIKDIHGNRVTFTDGQSCDADYIMLCTGYEYSFPFLSKDCGVMINDNVISPLYKHVIHADFHTLSFIGIPSSLIHFPEFSCQVQFAIAFLEGSVKLPSRVDIDEDNKKDLQKRLDMGWPHRYAHKTSGDLQWQYHTELAHVSCTMCPIKPVVKSLYDNVYFHHMKRNVWHYKELNFEILSDNEWHQIDKDAAF